MKEIVKTVVNKCMNAVGLEVVAQKTVADVRKAHNIIPRHKELLEEFEGFFREKVLSDLPRREGRTDLLSQMIGTRPTAAFFIVTLLNRCLKLEGDVCEFGVAQGATSTLMANELKDSSKTLWLFDSFQGLPMPTKEDVLTDDYLKLGSVEKYAGTMAYAEKFVLARLNAIKFPLSRVKLVKGYVDKTFQDKANLPAKVAFAYLDFDFYEPIKITMAMLDERMGKGGYVVVDDYGSFTEGAQKAVDEFAAANKARWQLEVPPKFAGHFAVLHKIA